MADYQLTQTGNEVQDILDSALTVTGSGVTLSQSGVDVQALLNDITKGKFEWTYWNDMDAVPSAGDNWLVASYDPAWSNRPTDYGIVLRFTAPYLAWSAEIAIAVGSEAGEINYRTTHDGNPWTQWRSLQPALTYTTYVNMLDTIPAQPTSATTASYTVPNNGWVYMYATRGSTAGNSLFLSVNGVTCYTFPAYDAYAVVAIIIPVTRGQTLKFTTDSGNATWTIRQLHFSR